MAASQRSEDKWVSCIPAVKASIETAVEQEHVSSVRADTVDMLSYRTCGGLVREYPPC